MHREQEEIEFTVATLSESKRRDAKRLAHGASLRGQIARELETGCEPEHYRVEWIKASVGVMVDTLSNLGREFNQAHKDDLASAQDFCDILVSTLATLKRAAQ